MLALAAVHRTGRLAIGDIAVVVAAAAAHRGEAFDASRALIDELKATVPIWKHQVFTDGTRRVGRHRRSDWRRCAACARRGHGRPDRFLLMERRGRSCSWLVRRPRACRDPAVVAHASWAALGAGWPARATRARPVRGGPGAVRRGDPARATRPGHQPASAPRPARDRSTGIAVRPSQAPTVDDSRRRRPLRPDARPRRTFRRRSALVSG